jgi:hypothetical protein
VGRRNSSAKAAPASTGPRLWRGGRPRTTKSWRITATASWAETTRASHGRGDQARPGLAVTAAQLTAARPSRLRPSLRAMTWPNSAPAHSGNSRAARRGTAQARAPRAHRPRRALIVGSTVERARVGRTPRTSRSTRQRGPRRPRRPASSPPTVGRAPPERPPPRRRATRSGRGGGGGAVGGGCCVERGVEGGCGGIGGRGWFGVDRGARGWFGDGGDRGGGVGWELGWSGDQALRWCLRRGRGGGVGEGLGDDEGGGVGDGLAAIGGESAGGLGGAGDREVELPAIGGGGAQAGPHGSRRGEAAGAEVALQGLVEGGGGAGGGGVPAQLDGVAGAGRGGLQEREDREGPGEGRGSRGACAGEHAGGQGWRRRSRLTMARSRREDRRLAGGTGRGVAPAAAVRSSGRRSGRGRT